MESEVELKPGDMELNEGLLDSILEVYQQTDQRIWWSFTGVSMSPYIRDGDMVLVQHSLRPIRPGDVIVFRRADGFVGHRVLFRRGQTGGMVYRTKGDNLRGFDAPVHQSSVLGRVVRIQKNSKSIKLEKPCIKFLNSVLAIYSYGMGIFFRVIKLRRLLGMARRCH